MMVLYEAAYRNQYLELAESIACAAFSYFPEGTDAQQRAGEAMLAAIQARIMGQHGTTTKRGLSLSELAERVRVDQNEAGPTQ